MKAIIRICLVAAFAAIGVSGAAQQAGDQTVVLPSPIMVVDFDRIFAETLYGRRIAGDVTAERERVQARMDQLAAELLVEERELTDSRADMEPEAFRTAAEAFDERAQIVRSSRETEQARLVQLRDSERAQFIERIQPILTSLMLERGAVVAMDRRAVIRAIGGANATQDAIRLIDVTLGDGIQEPSERPTLRPVNNSASDDIVNDPIAPDPSLSGSD